MSEITPGSSPKLLPPNTLQPPTPSVAGSDLAPVVIASSLNLWRGQLLLGSTMMLSASVAVFPFLFSAYYWSLLWCAFAILIGFYLRRAWQAKQASPQVLSIYRQQWRLKIADEEVQVSACADILLWSWIIILSLQTLESHRAYTLIILQDSILKEDWRRLRVWLRMALKDNL